MLVIGSDGLKLKSRPLGGEWKALFLKQQSDLQTVGWISFALSALLLVVGVRSWASRTEFVPSVGWMSPSDLEESRTIDLGIRHSMVADSSKTLILTAGFGEPEPDGTWIVELDSQLELRTKSGSPRALKLELFPFLFEDLVERDIDIRTSVGVEQVKLIDGINTVSVVLDGERRQKVDIGCSRVDSPRDLGIGADGRTLCAKLLSIQVD